MTTKPERVSDLIDTDAYVRQRVTVTNAGGGRGYESGLRTFDCPLCGESRQRGWVHVAGFAAGCFNAGCDANGADGKLDGGVVEWVRRLEGLRSRSEAWTFLHREFPRRSSARRIEPVPEEFEDFCTLPPCRVDWLESRSVIVREAADFIRRQWGLSREAAQRWGLGICIHGRHAWRVVIPIVMGGQVVSFQTRSFRNEEPKYLFARHGKRGEPFVECGRPAESCLFGVDLIPFGGDVLLVEGAGDMIAWNERAGVLKAAALLGQALTPQKIALLVQKGVSSVYVGLDDGDAERQRALDHAADLRAWGIQSRIVRWIGGKDAGQGARIEVDHDATSLVRTVATKLRG